MRTGIGKRINHSSRRAVEPLENRLFFSVGSYYVKADSTAGYADIWVNSSHPGTAPDTYTVQSTNSNYSTYFTASQPSGTTAEQVTVDASAGNPLPSDGLSITCLSSTSAYNTLNFTGSSSGDTLEFINTGSMKFGGIPISSSNTSHLNYGHGSGADDVTLDADAAVTK